MRKKKWTRKHRRQAEQLAASRVRHYQAVLAKLFTPDEAALIAAVPDLLERAVAEIDRLQAEMRQLRYQAAFMLAWWPKVAPGIPPDEDQQRAARAELTGEVT